MTEEGETATNGPASLRPDGSAIRNQISLSGRRPGELSTGNTPERCFANHAQLWPRLVAMVQPGQNGQKGTNTNPFSLYQFPSTRPKTKKTLFALFSDRRERHCRGPTSHPAGWLVASHSPPSLTGANYVCARKLHFFSGWSLIPSSRFINLSTSALRISDFIRSGNGMDPNSTARFSK